MPEGIGGRVMVQRTDIAGSVRCSAGRMNPRDDGMCRPTPNGALVEEVVYRKPLSMHTSAAKAAAVS